MKLVHTDRVTEQLDVVYATEDSSLDPILAEIKDAVKGRRIDV